LARDGVRGIGMAGLGQHRVVRAGGSVLGRVGDGGRLTIDGSAAGEAENMIVGTPHDAESLAAAALTWLTGAAREAAGGLTWPGTLADNEFNPTLYSGTSGVLPALLDAWRHFGDDRYADASLRGARSVAAAVDGWEQSGLYTGVAGMAVALRGVERVLGDPAAGASADRALDVLRSRFDGTGWNDRCELIVGNAGIALAALECGDVELARLAVERYPDTAEPTAAGVH
jgi:hypothetical protein